MDLTPGRSKKERVVPSSSSRGDKAAEKQVAEVKELMQKAWNSKKYQEECDAVKARLSDQNFNVKAYPDPLEPHPQQVIYPAGTDASTEARLREIMKKYLVPPADPPRS
ncbi:hypothetical protein MKZ38_009289 [Zalerion maritima]|uniref:Uncharacterized protein n=1 Tax=Zalerion maritima TaxID=339359 RepID=A0AAD5WTK2_9PEZI|nr:hypothetical protein MKZ38_009289 [Zalerion maritima]